MGIFSWLTGSKKDNFVEAYKEGAVVIDVRTKAEFKEGSFGKAKNIPLNKIEKNIGKIKAYNKPVIVICRSGARAGSAKSILEKEGVTCFNGGGWLEFRNALRK